MPEFLFPTNWSHKTSQCSALSSNSRTASQSILLVRSRLHGGCKVLKKAFITGITGQDGSYLAELLLAKGYEVHGMIRRASTFNTERIDHLYQDPHDADRRLTLHFGDIADGSRLSTLLAQIQPDEVYNLAAQSHVRVSFDEPVLTGDVTALGTTRLLEAVISSGVDVKFYQASSSEMFGAEDAPQDEQTPFRPQSPYGVSKLYSHWTTKNYREAHGLFAVSGILFNHESPRRGQTFVTRKISRAVARIQAGLQKELFLGNLEARRDWGYAPDYVIAMWRMLQQDEPKDLVVGTGSSLSVKDFLRESFDAVNLDWRDYVKFDERYVRPSEVDNLQASPALALQEIDWTHSVSPAQLAHEMVRFDIENLNKFSPDQPIGELWEQETA